MTDTRTFHERRRDAAAAEWFKLNAELQQVLRLVLGDRPGSALVTKLAEGDYVVEVPDRPQPLGRWTTVVGGKVDRQYFQSQDEALLHLISRRHLVEPEAAIYAGKLLGLP